MRNVIHIVCVAAVLGLGSAAMAVGIETVTVADEGNTGDTEIMGLDGTTGYGNVAYTYDIGKHEVTAGQYCEFLNAVAKTDTYGLYNSDMDSNSFGCQITQNGTSGTYTYDFSGRPSGTEADWVDRPVNYVSWGDAVRFSNWLTNGQPGRIIPVAQDANSTERGSYVLDGAMTDVELLAVIVPDTTQRATWASGSKPYYLLTSEDEWYKAAYYNPGSSSYYDYPTSSNTAPGYMNDSGNLSGTGNLFIEDGIDPGNYATHDGDGGTNGIGSPYYRTEVGEWENSDSPYGTFDQGGNVWEWNEAIIGSARGLRGASFHYYDYYLHASNRYYNPPTGESIIIGFRVSEVPEPATMSLLALGGLAVLRRRNLHYIAAEETNFDRSATYTRRVPFSTPLIAI
jgi:sulfatase modifying factor 1